MSFDFAAVFEFVGTPSESEIGSNQIVVDAILNGRPVANGLGRRMPILKQLRPSFVRIAECVHACTDT
jgi:hypothetical protein